VNPAALIFFITSAALLMSVPRKWAILPLLLGCSYMTMGQGIEVGSVSLPIYRMLLLVGVIRIFLRGENLPGGINRIDQLMIVWGLWVIFSSLFHDPERAGLVYACGIVFNQALIYFLIRIWTGTIEDIGDVISIVALLLVPIAIEMMFEKVSGHNLFSVFGGVPENTLLREGRLRAQGPFRHPILAGTVGATCIPWFISIFNRHRSTAILGIVAGAMMTIASASSGPIMSAAAGLGAIMLARFSSHLGMMRKLAIGLYVLLMCVMTKQPYYLISRIDFSGGSTGWHRSYLIDQTFKHLSEWWIFGTDKTRHWMPNQGFATDPLHTDITNFYIGFGVTAGLPAMILLISILATGFYWIGITYDLIKKNYQSKAFTIWCIGCSVFAHAVTGMSVAYFDQSVVFLWMGIAITSTIYSRYSKKDFFPATNGLK